MDGEIPIASLRLSHRKLRCQAMKPLPRGPAASPQALASVMQNALVDIYYFAQSA